jgi:KaiC/GvpD/RAD55 family RecA-like ATPase
MGNTDERFSTGIRFLDMEVGGGIPVGDIVALTAPPDGQTEVLFNEIARVQATQYVSTICADQQELREWIDPPENTPNDIVTVSYTHPDGLLDDPATLTDRIPSETCVILDPVNLLEVGDRRQYLTLLNDIKERLREVGSIAFLNCLAGESVPENRPLTLKRADHVWKLERSVDGGEVATSLLISKARGNSVPQEAISIELADQVRIDTSRNIA